MSGTRAQLRTLAYNALLGNTIAGQNVFLPRDWPTNSAKMPNISIQTPREQKHNRSGRNGPPFFNTVTWLQLRCQVDATDPGNAETDLETLVDDAERAVMGLLIGPPQYFQQIVQGEYEMSLSSDQASHIGEAVLLFGFEYAERFDAPASPSFTGMDITAAEGPNQGPAILATLLADCPAGSAVLTFAPPLNPALAQGLYILDRSNPAALAADTGVLSLDAVAGTVTMTTNAVETLKAGDTIAFVARVLAELDLDLPGT